MVSTHEALIYAMVMVAAADRSMTDPELATIGFLVHRLPIFEDFDEEKLPAVAARCADVLADEDGLDRLLAIIRDSMPDRLHETAYALAVEVAAADRHASQEELRILELMRHRLEIDRLIAAGIERGARARLATM
ncbi:MAG: tellurite resistance TerB family protein [Alphaproteobacteria bacterium]